MEGHKMDILKEIEGINKSKSMQDVELVELFETSKKSKGVILELGSFRGVSTIVMAKATNRKVIAVDPFIAHGTISQNKQNFLNNIRRFEVENQIELIEDFSKNFNIKGPLGLLLIDAEHTYEGVKHDYNKFAPLVEDGGYIVMHDFHLPGIKKFFDEAIWKDIKKFREFRIIKSLIVIRK